MSTRAAAIELRMRVSRQSAWFRFTTVRKAIVLAAATVAIVVGLGLILRVTRRPAAASWVPVRS